MNASPAQIAKQCKHCYKPIMKFTFSNGDQWWHMPDEWPQSVNNNVDALCWPISRGTHAEPDEL